MKKTINLNDFIQEFEDCNRSNQFSREGLRALFEHLEDLEQDCDMEIELDVIALCCEFQEFENLEEFHKEFDADDFPDIDTIRESTQVIEIDDESFIIGEL
jgi:hypothetical protein